MAREDAKRWTKSDPRTLELRSRSHLVLVFQFSPFCTLLRILLSLWFYQGDDTGVAWNTYIRGLRSRAT